MFKTQGVPSLSRPGSDDKKQFSVGYRWDPVKHVSDLNFASIKFPKNLLKNANCVDYIQVTGSEVRGRPSVSRHSSTASMRGQVSWSHLGQTSFNPVKSVGVASTLPAGVSTNNRGVTPPRGPLAGTYSSSTSSSSSTTGHKSQSQGNSPFGPIEEPVYANTLPRSNRGGATKKVEIFLMSSKTFLIFLGWSSQNSASFLK